MSQGRTGAKDASFARRVGRSLVWLLMACIPLQGMAMVMERIQGAAHVHVTVGSGQHAQRGHAPAVDLSLLVAAHEMRHSHGAARPHVEPLAMPAADSTVLEDTANHHAVIGRHLHQPDDATVLSVDDPAADADTGGGATSKRVFLDMESPPIVPAAGAAQAPPRAPLAAPENSLVETAGRRLERPPRHSQR